MNFLICFFQFMMSINKKKIYRPFLLGFPTGVIRSLGYNHEKHDIFFAKTR
jgi:hypothetical protein